MNDAQIKQFKEKYDKWDRGIYTEPFGVPDSEKRYVIWERYEKNGYVGGNYNGDEAEYFENEKPDNFFEHFDLILEEIVPNLSFLHYRKVQRELIKNSEKGERWDYYGNSTNWEIQYVVIDELEELLKGLGYEIT